MQRALVSVVVLVGILVIPLMYKMCSLPKPPPKVKVAPSGAPMSQPPEPVGNKSIGYRLTFGLQASDNKNPKDVVKMVCEAGDSTLDRALTGVCHPNVGDTSCRIVLPVSRIRKGAVPRPGGLSGRGWSCGELGRHPSSEGRYRANWAPVLAALAATGCNPRGDPPTVGID